MGGRTSLDTRKQMLQINTRQKDFYESRFEASQVGKQGAERAANMPTNLWTRMRRKVMAMRTLLGVEDQIYALHREWMHILKDSCVLDLGCSTGNYRSLWIAENCADYTGIDLSELATVSLNAKLRKLRPNHARAYAQDFLANSYPDNHFDLVYANSVLHHFKDIAVVLEELCRVVKPGGVVISLDPMMTEPLNRLVRTLYRPLQSDREWEWPFTRATFRLLEKYFEIADLQGYVGMTKLGFPFQMIPGLSSWGRAIGRWGLDFDSKYARRLGLPFFLCWLVTLRLRKPDGK